MKQLRNILGLICLGVLASQLGGCTTSGARPAYHLDSYNDLYWGQYGYRRGRYVGYAGYRGYGRGYGRYGRW